MFYILGYVAYLGYILLEHQHANPILQTFCGLVLEEYQKKNSNNGNHILMYVPCLFAMPTIIERFNFQAVACILIARRPVSSPTSSLCNA